MKTHAEHKLAQILAENRRREENKVLTDSNEYNYTILLKNGVVLHPKNRSRFSQLCYERYRQIRKAFGQQDGKQIVVIG